MIHKKSIVPVLSHNVSIVSISITTRNFSEILKKKKIVLGNCRDFLAFLLHFVRSIDVV